MSRAAPTARCHLSCETRTGDRMDYSPGLRMPCSRTVPVVSHPFFILFSIKDCVMTFSLSIGPLVSLIAGILILVMPRLLSTIVAVYLIVMGVLGLLGMHALKF